MSSKKLYIIAGERSGDFHASFLVKKLQEKSSQNIIIRGLGGKFMREQGVTTLVDINELTMMGFSDVLVNFYRISKILSKCKKDLLSFKPNLVILIDYGGFNLKVTKFCKKNSIPVFYYIPPKVWIWGKNRVYHLQKYVEQVFCIFPFEKQLLENYNVNVKYVGNPLTETINNFHPNPNFRKDVGLTQQPIIAVLPGSRKKEVSLLIGELIKVADYFPNYQFVIAGLDTLPKHYYEIKPKKNVTIIFENTYDLLYLAHVALVASGTATLETALFRVPQIVGYKFSWIAFMFVKIIAKMNVNNKFFSLVNILCNENVVSELLQNQCNAEKIKKLLIPLLRDTPQRLHMINKYDELIQLLGTKKPSEEISSAILQKIN